MRRVLRLDCVSGPDHLSTAVASKREEGDGWSARLSHKTTVERRGQDMNVTAMTKPTVRKLSHADYLRFPEDGNRHELIDGVHYVTPPPVMGHQRVIGTLYYLLRHYLEQQGGGDVFLSPVGVQFTLFDTVEPDLVFVSNERKSVLRETHILGAPESRGGGALALDTAPRRRHQAEAVREIGRDRVLGYRSARRGRPGLSP